MIRTFGLEQTVMSRVVSGRGNEAVPHAKARALLRLGVVAMELGLALAVGLMLLLQRRSVWG